MSGWPNSYQGNQQSGAPQGQVWWKVSPVPGAWVKQRLVGQGKGREQRTATLSGPTMQLPSLQLADGRWWDFSACIIMQANSLQ